MSSAHHRGCSRSSESRAISLSTGGAGCSEAPPSVAPVWGSTQQRLCINRAPHTLVPTRRCPMEVLAPRCCGLDIHQNTAVACLMTTEEGQQPVKELRTFRAMTVALLA